MPKDKTGQLLDVGDVVTLRGTIVELNQTKDFSSVTVEIGSNVENGPTSQLKLDTAQVTLDVPPPNK